MKNLKDIYWSNEDYDDRQIEKIMVEHSLSFEEAEERYNEQLDFNMAYNHIAYDVVGIDELLRDIESFHDHIKSAKHTYDDLELVCSFQNEPVFEVKVVDDWDEDKVLFEREFKTNDGIQSLIEIIENVEKDDEGEVWFRTYVEYIDYNFYHNGYEVTEKILLEIHVDY